MIDPDKTHPDKTRPGEPSSDGAGPRSVRLEETTVGDIDGWMVTVGNVMTGQWRDAAGDTCAGLSAEIGLYDEDREAQGERTVGTGAVLRIAGRGWRVTTVVAGQPSSRGGMTNGHVALARID